MGTGQDRRKATRVPANNLISYSGTIGGTGATALTVNPANENLSTKTYTFGTAGLYHATRA